MTAPSQQAKAAGLSSLQAVTTLTGVSPQTLFNWHRDKPQLFAVVLAGCKNMTADAYDLETTAAGIANVHRRAGYQCGSAAFRNAVRHYGLGDAAARTLDIRIVSLL